MAKTKTIICHYCDGLGFIDDSENGAPAGLRCSYCDGDGKVAKPAKVNPIPDHSVMVARLKEHFEYATVRDIHQGKHWYDDARAIADTLAVGTGYSVEQTASVIAVLSPNVAWDENVNAAILAVEGHFYKIPWQSWRGAGYGENKAKASDILDGDLTRLRGPKVTQFAKGILGDREACTVDMWMLRAVGVEDTLTVTPRRWTAIYNAISEAATECGYDTCTFQAIVWSKVRNETLAKNPKHAWRVA